MVIRARHSTSPAPRWRCVLVALVVTSATALLVHVLADDLTAAAALVDPDRLRAADIAAVLERASAVALVACAVWFWLVTVLVTFQAARGRTAPGTSGGCPSPVRRLLLLACGAVLASTLAAPAYSGERAPDPTVVSVPQEILRGLQVPDRAVSPPGTDFRSPPRAARAAEVRRHPGALTLRVRSGDTLWSIASEDLPRKATNAEITARWQAIYAANRGVIGADPDLILPDATLLLPDPGTTTDREDPR